MSDTELTDTEADRLRDVFHRAAGALEVTTPDLDSVDLRAATPVRRGRGRWLFAAAAVLVVVALGAGWWLTATGEDRVDTGPAEPPVTVAPQVLEQTGIWRLPEDLDGYRVGGAQDGGSFDSSSVDTPGVLAVDDTEDPTRWLMVQAYDELGELDAAPAGTRQVELSDEVTVTLVPTSGSTWFRVAPTGDTAGSPPISGSALGIDEAELTRLLAGNLGTVGELEATADSTDTLEALLDDAGFGDDRIVWQGAGDGGPGSRNQQVQVSLAGDDGSEVTIIMNRGDSTAWSAAVRLRLNAELISISSAGTAQGTISVRPRPELGPNVLENVAEVPGQPPATYLAVLSDDGAWLTALPTFSSATGLEPATSTTLPEEDQLRIINSLRAMSEDEFRARLAELGAEFIGADSVGTTTTVIGTPGG
jgi:hypothetical protein